mmetsp:Transcript_74885/g.86941  ORF Transcript_74885/g.86941 Transcript_74885/m.86941 type:complete len:154 (-) Transcript_74885:66-527(-)|eukprot:CAMPEP_0176411562 /NCGR_PEP_ID=MMETSP0127-20121128/3671_1 /TAXON_ID=938130 /ORGANISM="Platyophrya macrostoma, Strain WH" /LENGTH=153 /DNA_ID=CAMNT_0017791163 /DNA_START=168 /DNA_END=629 /DNA_ORIENTATION=+
MSIRAIASLSEFQTVIRQPKLTVVDFFAQWCGPCKAIAPQVQRMAEAKPNVNFIKVDVDQAGDVAAEYRIRAMPTFMFFKDGNKLHTFEGADVQQLSHFVSLYDTPVAPKIPSQQELEQMKPKDLLSLMQAHHISANGALEKSELIAEINKHR